MVRVVVAAATAVAVLVVVVGLAIVGGGGAVATRVETTYATGTPRCTMSGEALAATSGIAVLGDDVWVVGDQSSVLSRLGDRCGVAEAVDLEDRLAEREVTLRDVEDLSAGPDGWLWLADTGGNRAARGRVQLVGYQPEEDRIRVVTLEYPSGEYDVEAVIVGTDGRATLVEKTEGEAAVFSTAAPLREGLMPLVRRGSIRLEGESEGGARLATGGGLSGSGVFAVLRTYTTAWEYDVVDGDVAGAIVAGAPRRVAIPPSTQGEAVTYSADDSAFLLTGEGSPSPVDRVTITRRVVEVR